MSNSIEQIATKAAGTVKAVAAGFKGLRGLFLNLAEERGEAWPSLTPVNKAADALAHRHHFRHIRAELLSHETDDLADVYGVLDNQERLAAWCASTTKRSLKLQKAVADFDTQDFAHAETSPQSGVRPLSAWYSWGQAHMDEEENDFFARAASAR